jgi:hypothetical protein
LEAAKAKFDDALEKLRSDWLASGREPADFARMVQERITEALESKTRDGADRQE